MAGLSLAVSLFEPQLEGLAHLGWNLPRPPGALPLALQQPWGFCLFSIILGEKG